MKHSIEIVAALPIALCACDRGDTQQGRTGTSTVVATASVSASAQGDKSGAVEVQADGVDVKAGADGAKVKAGDTEVKDGKVKAGGVEVGPNGAVKVPGL